MTPVMYIDPAGHAILATFNWKSVAVAGGTGFVSGAIAASPLGLIGQVAAGGVISGVSYGMDCYVNDANIKIDELVISTFMGVLSGYIGGPGANKNQVLTKALDSTKNALKREARRVNQNYAQKAIRAIKTDLKSTLSNAAWSSGIRFAMGTGIANGFMAWYSLKDFSQNAPSWKPWEEKDEAE